MLKAIETEYNNYRFRSRLEARWAVFFDTLDIKYAYEKEGFDLNGTRYLPDFWLPKQDCFIEVKGSLPTCEEAGKAFLLSWFSGKPVHILWGEIKEPSWDDTDDNGMRSFGECQVGIEDDVYEPFPYSWLKKSLEESGIEPFNKKAKCIHEVHDMLQKSCGAKNGMFDLWTPCNWWSACIGCENIEIHPHGFTTRMTCGCVKKKYGWTESHGDYRSSKHPALEEAYKAARFARFEHGETGISKPKSRKKSNRRRK